jgi:two-component system sensor histidine kinase YesM
MMSNAQMLDLDIRNVTELVLENTQEYIYHEAIAMENVREQLSGQRSFALILTFFVFAGCIIWAALLIRNMQKNISRPLKSLSEKTKQVARGDFNVRAETETGNNEEIRVLNESFNSMTRHIGVLVDNIKHEQDEQRKTELRLLQAQINPHFLYNTLDTIIWLAEAGEKEKVAKMVGSLSDFFRTTLSKGKDFITVKEEELHVHSYLRIQRFRYQDIMDYEIHFPEEVLSYNILKLTLQPIVENALYHGIKEKRGKGLITVTAELMDAVYPDSSDSYDEKDILFTVRDNGIGMKPEELEKLRESVLGREKLPKDSGGFGLHNVNERIRLNYGQQYGLRIDSTYGEGTAVKVRIPARHDTTSE